MRLEANMRFSSRTPLILIATLLVLSCAARLSAQPTPPTSSASEHFLLDHNRVFVELTFVLPNGTQHKALAFVDSGDPTFTIPTALVKEFDPNGWKEDSQVHVLFGGRPLDTSAVKDVSASAPSFSWLHVEASLPATILEKYDVVLDYGKQTLTLAAPGSLKHAG